jgi:hypothetical protein
VDIVSDNAPGAQAPAEETLAPPGPGVDAREQLVNRGEVGPIGLVSIPEAMITTLRGIMLDFDPDLYDPTKLPAGATDSPRDLYETFVKPMLNRHPVYAKAEVRDTGRGLHAILWFETPVVFDTETAREKWAAVVKAVQKALPTDPMCPGITAMTRPVGSINGKTGRTVRVLKDGMSVNPEEILKLVAELGARPFKFVAGLLLDPAAPYCPVCARPEARLGVMDRRGQCYSGKHQPTVGDLFAAVFAPRSSTGRA